MIQLKSLTILFLFISITLAVPVAAQVNPFVDSDFELAEGDIPILQGAIAKLESEDVIVGESVHWRNPDSGNKGIVTYSSDSEFNGLSCRRIQHDIFLQATDRSFRFIEDRCKMEDGSWKTL